MTRVKGDNCGDMKKRRARRAHYGVRLIKRCVQKTGYECWIARFRDPDTGKITQKTLDPVAYPTSAARRQWAIRKSRALAKRRSELESGAPQKTNTMITQALNDYRKSCDARLRTTTLRTYEVAFSQFLRWVESTGIEITEAITPAKLAELRDFLVAGGKYIARKGGKRGARKKVTVKRSPISVNREIRTIKTMLNQWRRLGLLPLVDKDAISDALPRLETPKAQPTYLTPTQCQRLLEATLRHDRKTFLETREEHSGLREVGTTLRYQPIAPFALFLLLTGCRLNEALSLEWDDVDLQAADHNGNIIGAVNLRPEVIKTARGRQISLGVCPLLRKLLGILKLQADNKIKLVFSMKRDQANSSRQRLLEDFGSPKFRWKDLRSTCEVYLVNSPAIFGSASIYLAAQQLGHSVEIAQKHYLQATHGISPKVITLEEAMQINDQVKQIIDSVQVIEKESMTNE